MNRYRRLGLQKRIMLYVAGGLAVMFGTVAFLGLGAIDEATQLIYNQRLATAHTTAAILERDFAQVAAHVETESPELLAGAAGADSGPILSTLLDQFERTDPFTFSRVSGVWLLDGEGGVRAAAGDPRPASDRATSIDQAMAASRPGGFVVLRPLGPVPDGVPFAAVAVRLAAPTGASVTVVVHLVSRNSTAPFIPHIGTTAAESPADEYHLEVVDPDGVAVLGIGADERPGERSRHFAAIGNLMRTGTAAALLHEPGDGDPFEPHVMAVVPIAATPFFMVLEQPVDVALALPLQLRDRLFLWIALGFLATLSVAWVTTRHVVKPTEQLTAAAQRIAAGDLTSPIDVAAQDEVGRLADSLEAMRRRLKEATEAAERTNRELESRVADRTARLGQVLRQTISAQEEERLRLARELHDETAQTLAALSIALDRARDAIDGATSPALEQIVEAKAIAGRLLAETRRLILGLRPAVLDDLGLVAAIRWQCDAALAESGAEVTIEGSQPAVRLPGHLELTLFRIVQEAVSNVARHADARHVRIGLTFEDELVTVVVADDGHGFDVERALASSGGEASVGLAGMQERVALLGGQMKIDSTRGRGTTILVRVPLMQEAA